MRNERMDIVSELWNAMALTGKTVVTVLAILSIYSYAVMVDRFLALRWAQQRSAKLTEEIEGMAENSLNLDELMSRVEQAVAQGHCALGVVLEAALKEYRMLKGEGESDEMVMEGVEVEVGRSLDVAVANLRVRLPGMATIVGAAPFLGLFGTVTGLISAFRGIATSGGGGLTEVSAGISEALVTTVIGLFVAMPALWAYNFFMNRVDNLAIGLHNTASRLSAHLVRRMLRAGRAAG
jgi:biopolymer transport protein ExbB/biopolymer transport protein TolQ